MIDEEETCSLRVVILLDLEATNNLHRVLKVFLASVAKCFSVYLLDERKTSMKRMTKALG